MLLLGYLCTPWPIKEIMESQKPSTTGKLICRKRSTFSFVCTGRRHACRIRRKRREVSGQSVYVKLKSISSFLQQNCRSSCDFAVSGLMLSKRRFRTDRCDDSAMHYNSSHAVVPRSLPQALLSQSPKAKEGLVDQGGIALSGSVHSKAKLSFLQHITCTPL